MITSSPSARKTPAAQFDLGLFGHARDLVEIQEVASACLISQQKVRDLIDRGVFIVLPIGDKPDPKREHLRIKRFSVEAWYVEREVRRNGVEAPYRLAPDVQWWRGELKKRNLF